MCCPYFKHVCKNRDSKCELKGRFRRFRAGTNTRNKYISLKGVILWNNVEDE